MVFKAAAPSFSASLSTLYRTLKCQSVTMSRWQFLMLEVQHVEQSQGHLSQSWSWAADDSCLTVSLEKPVAHGALCYAAAQTGSQQRLMHLFPDRLGKCAFQENMDDDHVPYTAAFWGADTLKAHEGPDLLLIRLATSPFVCKLWQRHILPDDQHCQLRKPAG